MRTKVERVVRSEHAAKNAWIMFGGLIALGILAITVREMPAMRRELKLLRM